MEIASGCFDCFDTPILGLECQNLSLGEEGGALSLGGLRQAVYKKVGRYVGIFLHMDAPDDGWMDGRFQGANGRSVQ